MENNHGDLETLEREAAGQGGFSLLSVHTKGIKSDCKAEACIPVFIKALNTKELT